MAIHTRADPLVVTATVPTPLVQPLGFEARAVMVDNFSNQYCSLPDAGVFIVPGQTGRVILLDRLRTARLLFKAPVGTTQPGAIAGQTVQLTYYPYRGEGQGAGGVGPFEPNPGVVVPATDTNPADIAPLGVNAGAGLVGLAADAGHVHPGQWLDARTFGWDVTGVADSAAAVTAAIAALPATGGVILLPQKGRFSSPIVNSGKPVGFLGMGSASQPGVGGTLITVDAGVNAFQLLNGPAALGARSWIQGMRIVSLSAGAGTDDGILLQCNEGALIDVVVEHFGRHGVNQDSSANDITHNANNCRMDRVRCYQNFGDGFHPKGPNSNAGLYSQVDADTNGGWGFFEESNLGNVYAGVHMAGNTSGGFRVGNSTRNHAYGVYFESENKTALQLDAGGVNNVFEFTSCSRPDAASPIVDNSGGMNFIKLDQGGMHWTRLIAAAYTGGNQQVRLDGLASPVTLALLAGAQAQLQNAAADANWFAVVNAAKELYFSSAQGARFRVAATSIGTFESGVGPDDVGHSHSHTHGGHAHSHTHGGHTHTNTYGNGTTGAASAGTAHTHPYFDPSGTGGTGPPPVSGSTTPAADATATTPAADATGESATHTHKG